VPHAHAQNDVSPQNSQLPRASTAAASAHGSTGTHRRCLSAAKLTPLLKSRSNLPPREERAARGAARTGWHHELLSSWRPLMSLAMRKISISSDLMKKPQLRSSCSCSSLPRLVSRPPLSRYLRTP
jgi:hypothetical protein